MPSSTPVRSATASAASHARPRSPGTSGTSGTTSAAPTRGCTPVVPAQIDAVAGGRDAGDEGVDETALRLPRARRRIDGGPRPSGRRAGGHCDANASPISAIADASRPSDTFGTAASTIRTLRRGGGRGGSDGAPTVGLAHVRAPARVPAPVPGVAHRLHAARHRVAGGGDLHPGRHRRRLQRARRRRRARVARLLDRRDPRARGRPGCVDGRPPVHLGPAGARRGVRHARRAVRALPPAVVRLLRPQPDGAADVPRDDGPPVRALLPRLRADLLRPAHRDGRRRHDRPLLLQLAARARGARDHAADRVRRVPVQQGLAAGAAGRPAEARRRLDRGRGEHRRRPRREVLRAGGQARRRSSRAPPTPSSARRSSQIGSARSTFLCSPSCRSSLRRRCSSSPGAWSCRDRCLRGASSPSTSSWRCSSCRCACSGCGSDRRCGRSLAGSASSRSSTSPRRSPTASAPSRCRRARVPSGSRTSTSRTSRAGRCSRRSTSPSSRAGRSR